ncbi:MAG: delta-class carbonic anhydrase [Pseudomonadota bacterium]
MNRKLRLITQSALIAALGVANSASGQSGKSVSDEVIEEQRRTLASNSAGLGFGPQSPRDLNSKTGKNPARFAEAPAFVDMNLCNIHFHSAAEHKGGEFTRYAGNGDGRGHNTGYVYSGTLSAAETIQLAKPVCVGNQEVDQDGPEYLESPEPVDRLERVSSFPPADTLNAGDTIEVQYVYSTALVRPGPTLNSCLSESIINPQLRIEAQVFVLVNDPTALDFRELAKIDIVNGRYQAPGKLKNLGDPVRYLGSTSSPSFNTEASPVQVSWTVYPKVAKVDINSVGAWCKDNPFNEHYPHGVRNLIVNPSLLSPIP